MSTGHRTRTRDQIKVDDGPGHQPTMTERGVVQASDWSVCLFVLWVTGTQKVQSAGWRTTMFVVQMFESPQDEADDVLELTGV